MIFNQLQLGTHIAPFLLAALVLFMLARTPFADAQELTGGIFSDSSFGKSGEISGTVYRDKGDSPASRAIVTIRSMPSGITRSVLSDYDGHFRVDGLPRGTYLVIAESNGYNPDQVTTQVNGFPSDISLHLKPLSGHSAEASGLVSARELKIPDKAREEYQRGLASLLKEDPAGSLIHLNKAVQIFPSYYEAFYHMGVAETRLNHSDKALEQFQKAIDLSGGHYATAQFAYGLLLTNKGKPREGERVIRAGLEGDLYSPVGYCFLALSLVAQNRPDEAEKSVREALLRKPEFADAYLVLSDVHAERNDYAAQLRDLDTFLRLAPNAPQAPKIRQIRAVVQHLVTPTNAVTAPGTDTSAN